MGQNTTIEQIILFETFFPWCVHEKKVILSTGELQLIIFFYSYNSSANL